MADSEESFQIQQTSIPVIAEELNIEKRIVETAQWEINTAINEHVVHVDEPLHHDETEVVRVPVNAYVDDFIGIRQEGDTTIVPVLEERAVIIKKWFLKEEIHLKKRSVETRLVDDVCLRVTDTQIHRVEKGTPPEKIGVCVEAD